MVLWMLTLMQVNKSSSQHEQVDTVLTSLFEVYKAYIMVGKLMLSWKLSTAVRFIEIMGDFRTIFFSFSKIFLT